MYVDNLPILLLFNNPLWKGHPLPTGLQPNCPTQCSFITKVNSCEPLSHLTVSKWNYCMPYGIVLHTLQNDVFLTEFKKLVFSTCDILQGGAALHMIILGNPVCFCRNMRSTPKMMCSSLFLTCKVTKWSQTQVFVMTRF